MCEAERLVLKEQGMGMVWKDSVMAELPGGDLHPWTRLQEVAAVGRDPEQGRGGEHTPGGPCAKAFNPWLCIP